LFYTTEILEDRNTLFRRVKESIAPSPTRRYIVFRDYSAQGRGNVMHGLLAVHMLAKEYSREVCVQWASFDNAFRSRKRRQECLEELKMNEDNAPGLQTEALGPSFLRFMNFDRHPLNECRLHELLMSNDTFVYIQTNTYPGWSQIVPGLWDEYYEPTEEL